MKLYTTSQVELAIIEFVKNDYKLSHKSLDETLAKLTPIELPSDEEIHKGIDEYIISPFEKLCWECGAKWVIDKIKNQSNQ